MSNLVEFALPKTPLPLTVEQRKELEEARRLPFVYDEESPPLTDSQLKKFRRVNPAKQAQYIA